MPSVVLAWIGTVLWLGLAVVIVFAAGVTRTNLAPLLILMLPVAVFGPVALIWVWYSQSVAMAVLAADHVSLRRDIAALSQPPKTPAPRQTAAQPTAASAPVGQPALELADRSARRVEPLSTSDIILALNFPADADDTAGFRALKRALADAAIKPVVTAAQDVLTLLSQNGLYMDDLPPEPALAETWRRFARGERGAAVRDIGGIRAPGSIETVADRLREDAIFRDTALHFLRIFDKLVARIEPDMTDAELTRLGDTRSARAFMVIGRAIGTFD